VKAHIRGAEGVRIVYACPHGGEHQLRFVGVADCDEIRFRERG
jgi:hypothetical protein